MPFTPSQGVVTPSPTNVAAQRFYQRYCGPWPYPMSPAHYASVYQHGWTPVRLPQRPDTLAKTMFHNIHGLRCLSRSTARHVVGLTLRLALLARALPGRLAYAVLHLDHMKVTARPVI